MCIARHPERFRLVALAAHTQRCEACARRSAPSARLRGARRSGGAAAQLQELLGTRGARHARARRPGSARGTRRAERGAVRDGGDRRRRGSALHARGGPRRQAPAARQQGIAGHGGPAADGRGAALAARRCCPIDSEHNAIFQCLPAGTRAGAAARRAYARAADRLRRPVSRYCRVRGARDASHPRPACAHPNWVMGRKISVDSATLMNKGLELIEALLAVRR